MKDLDQLGIAGKHLKKKTFDRGIASFLEGRARIPSTVAPAQHCLLLAEELRPLSLFLQNQLLFSSG